MMDINKELDTILETDPLGLLKVKPKTSAVVSANERLVASFQEVNAFMRKYKREPGLSKEVSERKLYSRLKRIRENPEKAMLLLDFDIFNLLGDVVIPELEEINTVDDVLAKDVLGLLQVDVTDDADPNAIFDLRNVPKPIDLPDYIAKRRPCEDFEKFEPIFKQMHIDLASGEKVTEQFTGERQISSGEFFILQGMLVYVANIGEMEKKNFGNVNARLYCVFENGTESNMLLRSLAAALWKEENSRHIVAANQMELFDNMKQITAEDNATGYLYVLSSLSENSQIQEIEDLYKIGFSRQPVIQRIQNAKQDPTYLMANVKVEAEFETYNLNPQKLESLLHKFFARACLNLDVFDSDGKRHTPREWFIVPLQVIETAAQLLISGDIINYYYDIQRQEIFPK